jgi:hypothetical protein
VRRRHRSSASPARRTTSVDPFASRGDTATTIPSNTTSADGVTSPCAPGVETIRTRSPTRSGSLGNWAASNDNPTVDIPGSGYTCAVTDPGASSWPACRSTAARCPTSWPDWFAGTTLTDGSTPIRTTFRYSAVMTWPRATSTRATSTSWVLPRLVYAHADTKAPTIINARAVTTSTGRRRNFTGGGGRTPPWSASPILSGRFAAVIVTMAGLLPQLVTTWISPTTNTRVEVNDNAIDPVTPVVAVHVIAQELVARMV